MRGKVLGFDVQTGDGMISGDDGIRYPVTKQALGAGVAMLRSGQAVDFEVDQNNRAVGVFIISTAPTPDGFSGATEEKSKITAALLAFFLGGLGVHKFYLGTNSSGLAMLLISLLGWPLLFIPNLIIGLIGLIEAIIYITKTDESFYLTYVANKRAWF